MTGYLKLTPSQWLTKCSEAKRPWTPEHAQPSIDTLQQCLKDHALQSMDILLVIVENLRDNKLDVKTVNR